MPRKFSNLNDKRIKGKKHLADRNILTKLRGSTLLNEKRNLNLIKILKSEICKRCSNDRPLKCINSNNNWDKRQKMAVEFDHMYLQCGNSKTISCDFIKELKDFNVLHLNLIQQQCEQLAAKEKKIKALQDENKALKAKLVRIERRLSLNVQKKLNEVLPISVQTDFPSQISCLLPVKSELSPKSGNQSQLLLSPNVLSPSRSPTHSDSNETLSHGKLNKKETLRKPQLRGQDHSTPPVSPTLRISPRERRSRRDSQQEVETNLSNINNNISSLPNSKLGPESNLLSSQDSSTSGQKRASIEDSLPPIKKVRHLSGSEQEISIESKEDGLTDHNLRSRDKTKDYISRNYKHTESLMVPMPFLSEPVEPTSSKSFEKETLVAHQQSPPEVKKLKGKPKENRKVRSEGILTTDKSYFINTPRHFGELSSLDENDDTETQVEIPRWRIKALSSLYIMEGTENLEDEIFVKRHAKLEHDERRRKRWDLQRLREQRQYERLLERYEVRNNQASTSAGHHSLWPIPESTHVLEIDETLPVCAFGQPLAQITQSDFSLPWCPESTNPTVRRRRR